MARALKQRDNAAALATFARWLKLDDVDVLDVIAGAFVAHQIPGDPLWLLVVGPPGGAKTEILRAISHHPDAFPLSKLTPKTLISGLVTEAGDPSLLPQLDGKVVIIKDFTVVLQMPCDARNEVFSSLRDAYDGSSCQVFGTGETKRYDSRFGLIAAVTGAIDGHSAVHTQLGERFLKVRIRSEDRSSAVRQSLLNAGKEAQMRAELRKAAESLLVYRTPARVPGPWHDRLIALADFLAIGRSSVARDRAGDVAYKSDPEVGTRIVKQFANLCQGIGAVRSQRTLGEDVYRMAARVATDSLPSLRSVLFRALWEHRGEFAATDAIARACRLDSGTARRHLADLHLLGAVEQQSGSRSVHLWRLSGSFQATIQAADIWPHQPTRPPASGRATRSMAKGRRDQGQAVAGRAATEGCDLRGEGTTEECDVGGGSTESGRPGCAGQPPLASNSRQGAATEQALGEAAHRGGSKPSHRKQHRSRRRQAGEQE